VNLLYRASFFLYEISFLLFAGTLAYAAWSGFRINRALRQPAYWVWPGVGAVLLSVCAWSHFHVYHRLSPQYLVSASPDLLIQMYILKTVSMAAIFATGAGLAVSGWLYLRRIRH